MAAIQYHILYDIYTEDEKRQDPEKRDTGLFFFRGNKNAPFAVICAGGGFYYVGSIHESMPHALWLARHGYNAFALVYRTRTADAACQDLSRAISFIFAHKDELGVDTNGYSLWGGSAGARMAAYTGSFGPVPRAAAVIMQYTGYSLYTQQDPPTYACVGGRDYIADWRIMKRRLDCLEKCGISTEFHMYPNLKHGFGLGIETQARDGLTMPCGFGKETVRPRTPGFKHGQKSRGLCAQACGHSAIRNRSTTVCREIYL